VIVPVWVFYLIKDRPALTRAAEASLPAEWRPDARAASGLGVRVFGQWLRGQVFLGFVVGIATFIGLEILSFTVDPVFGRFAVLLSVIAGVLELLPIIGPIIAAIPAVILGLTAASTPRSRRSPVPLIQQVENHVLVPKIQGDAVELHPTSSSWPRDRRRDRGHLRGDLRGADHGGRARPLPLRVPPGRRPAGDARRGGRDDPGTSRGRRAGSGAAGGAGRAAG
jgi:hypothetical protein